MLVNPSKIYVNINNKAVILLLMAIYNKNQATVSQNHTKDCSRLEMHVFHISSIKRRRRRAFHGNIQSVSSIKSKSPG